MALIGKRVWDEQPQSVWRYLLIIGAIAIGYIATAYLSITLLGLSKILASPLWPPAGIVLAALLIFGRSVWPGVALGAFGLAQVLGASFPNAISVAISTTLQALAGELLLRRFGFQPTLERLRDVYALIVLAAMGSPVVNATLSTITGVLFGAVPWHHAARNWWVLWLGDGMGILVITPVLLLLYQYSAGKCRRAACYYRLFGHSCELLQRIKILVWFGLLVVGCFVVFWSKTKSAIAQYPLEYIPFPLILWSALRLGLPGAMFASLIVSAIAIGGAAQQLGPFIAKSGGDVSQAVVLLQAFIGVMISTAMVLAAAVTERQRAEEELLLLNASLEWQVDDRTAQLREKMEELRLANTTRQVFSHTISHDLKTTVMGMLMVFRNLLNKSEVGISGGSPVIEPNVTISRAILQRLVEGSERQLGMINSLLEAYSEHDQAMELRRDAVVIKDVADEALQQVNCLITKNQAVVINALPADLPPVDVDRFHLSRVFQHLLSNALQHNPPGVEIRIDAKLDWMDEQAGCREPLDTVPGYPLSSALRPMHPMLRCTVQDNGVGLQSCECDRLFELYTKGADARYSTGIGLGLYLCRQIINAHGGQIGVISQPGSGSTFWFTVPLANFLADPLDERLYPMTGY